MATPARFERAAYGLGNRCSILLSYGIVGGFQHCFARLFNICPTFVPVGKSFVLSRFHVATIWKDVIFGGGTSSMASQPSKFIYRSASRSSLSLNSCAKILKLKFTSDAIPLPLVGTERNVRAHDIFPPSSPAGPADTERRHIRYARAPIRTPSLRLW